MIGNPPFPDRKTLRAWADSGVTLIVIMEGVRWVGGRIEHSGTEKGYFHSDTDRFWRMGGYPPYSNATDMADLGRLVEDAHRFGMKVVPYTAPAEFHPEVLPFCRNVLEWRQQPVPNGGTVFHATGNYPGAIWGGLVCPDCEGVRRHYLKMAKTYVRNYNFDGVYIDLASKVYCHNTAHGGAHHGGIDGLWSVLSELREFLGPDKVICAHNGDCNMMVALSNLADSVVTMEAMNSSVKGEWDLDTIRPYIRAFPSSPNMLIPSYKWFWNWGRENQEAMADGLAKSVLLGSAPHQIDLYFDPPRWGYRDAAQQWSDPRSIWELFRRLTRQNLKGMQFRDYREARVRTNRQGVLGAEYVGPERRVLVLSNLTPRTQRNIQWRCGRATGTVKALDSKDYVFIEITR